MRTRHAHAPRRRPRAPPHGPAISLRAACREPPVRVRTPGTEDARRLRQPPSAHRPTRTRRCPAPLHPGAPQTRAPPRQGAHPRMRSRPPPVVHSASAAFVRDPRPPRHSASQPDSVPSTAPGVLQRKVQPRQAVPPTPHQRKARLSHPCGRALLRSDRHRAGRPHGHHHARRLPRPQTGAVAPFHRAEVVPRRSENPAHPGGRWRSATLAPTTHGPQTARCAPSAAACHRPRSAVADHPSWRPDAGSHRSPAQCAAHPKRRRPTTRRRAARANPTCRAQARARSALAQAGKTPVDR